MAMFMKLYGHYKNNWDYEAKLMYNKTTYHDAEIKSMQDEEWIK